MSPPALVLVRTWRAAELTLGLEGRPVTNRAVIFATNYAGQAGMELSGCENDGRDMADLLRTEAECDDVTMLLGGDATRENILDALREGVAKTKYRDRLYTHYSGHGTQARDLDGDERDRLDEMICPHDLRDAGGITDDTLYAELSQHGRGEQVVSFFDCCFSGTLNRFAPPVTHAVPPLLRMDDPRMTADHAEAILEQYAAATESGAPLLVNGQVEVVPAVPSRRVKFLPPALWVNSDRELRAIRAAAAEPELAVGRGGFRQRGALTFSACADTEVTYDTFVNGRPCGIFTHVLISSWRAGGLRKGRAARYVDWYAQGIRLRLPSEDFPQVTPQLDGTATQQRWEALK